MEVEYIRGVGMGGGIGGLLYSERAGGTRVNHFNPRGDITAQTDGSQNVQYQALYDAFGEHPVECGSNPDPQRANTKPEDPTGLLNEGYRYRDLETGTFINRDPVGMVDGPNLYAYVGQNPWTQVDPQGLQAMMYAYAPEGYFGGRGSKEFSNATALNREAVAAGLGSVAERALSVAAGWGRGLVDIAVMAAHAQPTAWVESIVSNSFEKQSALAQLRGAGALYKEDITTSFEGIAGYAGYDLQIDPTFQILGELTAPIPGAGLIAGAAKGGKAALGGYRFGRRIAPGSGLRLNREYRRLRAGGVGVSDARRLVQEYRGKGHHWIPERIGYRKLHLPRWFMESRFNLMGRAVFRKGKGNIPQGRQYVRHARADRKFKGVPLSSGYVKFSDAGIFAARRPLAWLIGMPDATRAALGGIAGLGIGYGAGYYFGDD